MAIKTNNPYLDEAQGIYDEAETAGRELTPKERGQVAELTGKAREMTDKQLRADVFGEDGPTEVIAAGDGTPSLSGNWGERFVKSEGYRRIGDPMSRGQTWSSGAIEVGSFRSKAGTVLEGAQGAGLVPVPQVILGVAETLFEPLGRRRRCREPRGEADAVRALLPQRHRLLRQPGGFEGLHHILTPFEPRDPAAAEGPGMRLLLGEFPLAFAAACVPGHGGDHGVPAVEQLVQLVPRFLPDLGETAHRSHHLGRATANTGLDRIWGIDVFDVRSGELEQPQLRISIDQPLVIDTSYRLDVLLGHASRIISPVHPVN
jgi:hypothetical protein